MDEQTEDQPPPRDDTIGEQTVPGALRQVPGIRRLDVSRTVNLLLTLATLGEAPYSVVHRVCFFRDVPPDSPYRPWRRSIRTVRTILPQLERAGLVSRQSWGVTAQRRHQRVPQRCEDLWALTPAGHTLLAGLPQYPRFPRQRSHTRLRTHDQVTVQVLAHLIEQSRFLPLTSALSGLFVTYEYRLDPPSLRPRADALLIVRFGGPIVRPDLIPWTRYKPTRTEALSLRLLLETDRDSEPGSVIAEKARTYRTTMTDRWLHRYGYFPFPLWIVPSETRLQQVNRLWATHWPRGGWMITTDGWLRHDRWIEYFDGTWRERTLFNATRIQAVVAAATGT